MYANLITVGGELPISPNRGDCMFFVDKESANMKNCNTFLGVIRPIYLGYDIESVHYGTPTVDSDSFQRNEIGRTAFSIQSCSRYQNSLPFGKLFLYP